MPDHETVIEGESAHVRCEALGKPQPVISWIRTSDHKNLTSGYNGELHIEKVTREDDTFFKCVASNKAGNAEKGIKFNVRSKPEILDSKNGTAKVGTVGKIECRVYGNPLPTVTIRFDHFYVL